MNLFNNKKILQSKKNKKLAEYLKCIKRIFVLLLLLIGLHISAFAYSQSNINVEIKAMTIREALKKIENQTEYRFFYSDDLVYLDKKTEINVTNGSIDDVLQQLFKSSELEYRIFDNNVVVVSVNEKLQQDNLITGTVTDADGVPLPGVNVQVKGTQIGTISNVDGKFSLSVPNTDAILVFSYVGFMTQEIPVGERRSINVNLSEDTRVIDEVVVVAYGTQKKVSMTGAVSTIAAEKIENRPVANLSSSLSGLAAGVTVRQSSGRPGDDGATIRIRGTGTFDSNYRGPMVIIDGAEGNMDSVNPDDVESISILKDAASAALYGSRAANGVVLVTTKKGKTEATPRVTYSGIFSVSQPTKTIHLLSDYATYMEYFNRVMLQSGSTSGKYSQSDIDTWREASKNPNSTNNEWGIPNWLAYPNTDWCQEIFDNRFYQRHNLSVTGGSKTSNYLLSAGYINNSGTVENTGMKRYQFRINLESKIADFLTVGTQTFASKDDLELGSIPNITNSLACQTPKYNGKFGSGEHPADEGSTNLIAGLYSSDGENSSMRINTSWYANAQLFDGLTASVYFNYQLNRSDRNTWSLHNDLYSFRTNEIVRGGTTLPNATVSSSDSRSFNYTARAILNYAKSFGDHDISAMLGYEQFLFNSLSNYAQRRGLMDWSITDITTATEMVSIGVSGTYGAQYDYAMISYLGRFNYAYKNKYLFEATFRRDGSSRFSPDDRWGTFPSFSAGWRISEEAFMEGLSPIFSNLKLRASWGKLGNTTSGYYDWQSVYAKVNTSFGGSIFNGLAQEKLGNPLLQWENVKDAGIGLDASFLSNRLGVELDYYDRLTEGILTSPSIYLTMGMVGAPTKNTSDMRNRGIEIKMDWNDRAGDFRYGVSANFSYNKNKIVKYLGKLVRGWEGSEYVSNIGDVATTSGNAIRTEGHMIDEFFFFETYKGTGTYYNADGSVDINGGPRDGMIRTPADYQWIKDMVAAGYQWNVTSTVGKSGLYYGEIIAADTNGDGIYGNSHDLVFKNKSSIPCYNLGIGLNASWKGFDFAMQWAGNFGFYYYWKDMGINDTWMADMRPMSRDVLKNYYFYNEDDPNDPYNNINGIYPRMRFNHSGADIVNDVYLYDSSYLRLKYLQIGYNLPKKWTQQVKVNNLRLYFTGENLLTFTNYIGLDPEQGGAGNGSNGNAYPATRQVSLGINITF